MDKNLKCAKCGGSMLEGLQMQLPQKKKWGTISRFIGMWVEGKAEKGSFFGPDYSKRRRHPLTSYCCEKCGYVESYANLELDEAGE